MDKIDYYNRNGDHYQYPYNGQTFIIVGGHDDNDILRGRGGIDITRELEVKTYVRTHRQRLVIPPQYLHQSNEAKREFDSLVDNAAMRFKRIGFTEVKLHHDTAEDVYYLEAFGEVRIVIDEGSGLHFYISSLELDVKVAECKVRELEVSVKGLNHTINKQTERIDQLQEQIVQNYTNWQLFKIILNRLFRR